MISRNAEFFILETVERRRASRSVPQRLALHMEGPAGASSAGAPGQVAAPRPAPARAPRASGLSSGLRGEQGAERARCPGRGQRRGAASGGCFGLSFLYLPPGPRPPRGSAAEDSPPGALELESLLPGLQTHARTRGRERPRSRGGPGLAVAVPACATLRPAHCAWLWRACPCGPRHI